MSRGRRETDGREQRDGAGAAGKKADLHDANPLVLGTRTGRPSDAPIPLCLCKTPASTIPLSGSIAGGEWLPTICRFGDRMVQSDWEDREGRGLTKWSPASMVG